MDEEHQRMKPDLLATFLMLGAIGGQEPRGSEEVPIGYECISCHTQGGFNHKLDCHPPRGIRKV